jgi:glycosyltransferase involved in cell wall biosynthesis
VSAITELLADPAERRRLAGNARRRLAADYSRDEVRRQLLDVVQRIQAAPEPTAEFAGLSRG